VGLFLCLLLFRLTYIQGFKKEEYSQAISKQILSSKRFLGNRGTIYDALGKRLAYNTNIYTLIINPKFALENPETLTVIKEFIKNGYIEGKYPQLEQEIISMGEKNKMYKILGKNIGDKEKDEMMEIMNKYNKDLVRKKVLIYTPENKRRYFRSDLFFNLVGNVGYRGEDKIQTGIFGIEKEYEEYLKGIELIKKIPSTRGRIGIKLPTSKMDVTEDLDGKNVYLTIDSDIHYILNDELKKEFDKTKAEEAYAIVADPNTGRILATSSYSRKKEVRNPLFQNQVEPGSIFKPIIVAAALNSGYIKRTSTFDIGDGKIKKYNHIIKESSRNVKGILTVDEILEKSSNVGMVLIGDRFTDEEFEGYLKKYGLYDKTDVDFPYERKPYTVSYKKWDKLKKSTMAFGQGIVVTPVQMISAFSAVVNGGILYKPYLVDKIVDKNGVVIRRNLPTPVRRVISENVSKTMREILEKAVEEGTVKNAGVEGYRVGGKTGTAQISDNGKYVKHEYLASTVGFFPVDKPKYIILVMVLKPQADILYHRFGGAVAAPVVGEVIRRVTKAKNIYSEDIAQINMNTLLVKDKTQDKEKLEEMNIDSMPDLKGMSARDVLNLFKDSEYEIKVTGTGSVISQYPKVGDKMDNVKTIRVILSREIK
ncbi:MAG: penicillin-binding protein, partial [Cetobacterium sp.]